jgi:hypothetical protein
LRGDAANAVLAQNSVGSRTQAQAMLGSLSITLIEE